MNTLTFQEVKTQIAEAYNRPPITDFASITPNTTLEDLNLNWRERDLPEKVRTKHVHRLHPYLGKFIPQLVEVFLRKYQPELVYDPFSGSGTTLVEANSLGIASVGVDISVFNTILTKVKTTEYDLNVLRKELFDILTKVEHLENDGLFDKARDIKDEENEYLRNWFAPQARKELLYYLSLIPNYTYQDLLKIILSRSARSARLTTHFDLDFPKKPQTEPYRCYKHSRICEPVQEAYKFLRRYTIDTYKRIEEFSHIRTNAPVTVIHDDARTVTLPHGIDCIITSPPYIGLIDYHAQHKYAYELLGLKNNETSEIGRPCNGSSPVAQEYYIKAINEVLLHARDHMTDNSLMIIVANDKYNLYNPEKVGFKWEGRVERHVNRRTGRRNGAFYESILIWRKA